MKVLLDTSVLVAATIEGHPAHERSLPWLQRIKMGTDTGIVSAHSIAELYAIFTRLPVKPRISPALAFELIQRNVIDICKVVALSEKDYGLVIKHLAETGVIGGITYDAVILYTALKETVDRIITLNENDFRRIYPQIADWVFLP